MTDYPRFEKPRIADDRSHRQFHGGRLVELVLRVAEHWRQRRATESIDGLSARAMMDHFARSGRLRASPAHDIDCNDPVTAYDLATLEAVRAAPAQSAERSRKWSWSRGSLLVAVAVITLAGLAWWATGTAKTMKPCELRPHAVAGPFFDERIALP